jgi:hypothetical protein
VGCPDDLKVHCMVAILGPKYILCHKKNLGRKNILERKKLDQKGFWSETNLDLGLKNIFVSEKKLGSEKNVG